MLLKKRQNNFVSHLTFRRAFRKIVISAILATDMTQHTEMIKEADGRFGGGSIIDATKENDRQFLCNLLVHSSDLSNPVLPKFSVVDKWARLVCAEFTEEAESAKALNVGVQGFMDDVRNDWHIASLQVSFISFVVAPLWGALASILPSAQPFVDCLQHNKQEWQERVRRCAIEAAKAAAADAVRSAAAAEEAANS